MSIEPFVLNKKKKLDCLDYAGHSGLAFFFFKSNSIKVYKTNENPHNLISPNNKLYRYNILDYFLYICKHTYYYICNYLTQLDPVTPTVLQLASYP